MTKIKYDVSDVEAGQDFDSPVPKGLYVAEVEEVEETVSKSSGDPMLKITYSIFKGDFKGRKLWDYIVLSETQEWKMRQFVDALNMKAKGTLDTNKIEGTKVQIRTKVEGTEDSEYGIQARIKNVLAMPEDTPVEEDDEEPDDADVEETEADDDGLTLEDLQGYTRKELKEVIKENDLEITVKKSMSDEDIVAAIAEEFEFELPDDEEADDDEEDDEVDDEEDDEVDDDEEDEEEAGYDAMSLKDLKATAKERGLPTSGAKKAIIKRLEEDDSSDSDGDPF